jgi:aminopeptidase YwaD
MKHILLILITLQLSLSFSQKEYGRELVDKLASDEFLGRGYVNNGDKIAANFIAEEFKKHGALPVGDSYFQKYNFDVNTFPGSVAVNIGDKSLKTGEDFIVNPSSGSAQGIYKLVQINEENFAEIINKREFGIKAEQSSAYVIQFDKPKDREQRKKQFLIKQTIASLAPLFVVNDEKFTWSVGREALKFPIIEIKSEFLQGDSTAMLNIENTFIKDYETQNVIGYIPAKKKCKSKRDKFIVFSAHYDHLGIMGETAIMNGANDNASGTAMMLTLMEYYSKNKPEYSLLFIAFGGEEAGLIGSKFYVENPTVPLKKIKFVFNVDLMGTGSEGITVVNATEHPKEFGWLQEINEEQDLLKQVKKRGKAANSDHYWFEEAGVPSFFVYTMGGVTHYHDIKDRPETLPLTEFNDLHRLIVCFINKF